MFKTTALDSVANRYIDKDVGTSTSGTRLEAADRNIEMDELVNAVEGIGLTLDPTGVNRDQLFEAMTFLSPYESVMTGNETFTAPTTIERKYFLDPNGASRNFDPSGVFSKGFQAMIINVGGSFNIVFDSGASAQTLTPGSMGTFIYDGSKWW